MNSIPQVGPVPRLPNEARGLARLTFCLEPEGRQHELRAAKRRNPRAYNPNRHRRRELSGGACAARKAKSGLAIKKRNNGLEHRITLGTGSENCQTMFNEVMNWTVAKESVTTDNKISFPPNA